MKIKTRGNLIRGIIHPRTSTVQAKWKSYLSFDTINGTGINATFTDSSGRVWTQFNKTVGTNAIVRSTTQVKYGTGSMSSTLNPPNASAPPSNAYCLTYIEPSGLNVIGVGDFTIDFWYYPTTGSQTSILWENLTNDTTPNVNFYIGKTNAANNGLIVSNLGTNIFNIAPYFVLNVWQRVTITRVAGVWYAFKDGNLVGTNSSFSLICDSTRFCIGGKGPATAAQQYGANGFIDEFVMLVGNGLFTSNFDVNSRILF